jgi:hypothetical protein
MSITRIDNIFSQEEIEQIQKTIADSTFEVDNELGRIRSTSDLRNMLNPGIIDRFENIVKNFVGTHLTMSGITFVEYNLLYGKPNLPPHFDGDFNDLIINMQLSSNTVWDVGLNSKLYRNDDNSALLFNPNKEIHWRTIKDFKDGEYVKMMFVRFYNLENKSDYSHLRLSQDDPIFKDAVDFRESLYDATIHTV